MKDLVIIGASGFGREVAWLVERINATKETWNLIGFIDDNEAIHGSYIGGYPVIGDCRNAAEHPDTCFICAIGAAKVRRSVIAKLESIIPNPSYATLIDPSVIISDRVKIGQGCVICAGNIITVDVEIGNHVIINLDCTIGHDAIIHDFVTVYPSVNISGITTVGECAELGTGAQIIQGKAIGRETIVGAGAVVIRDITTPGVYIGIPARKMQNENDMDT